MSNNIKVVCRFRPQNSIEQRENGQMIVGLDPNGETVTLGFEKEPNESNTFTFDRVFGANSTQREVFDYSIKSTVDDVLNGYNGTVFAYGQTGSGKTFTMMGSDMQEPNLKGIIPRIVESIFDKILESPETMEYTVNVSYMEIYMERIRDLLHPQNDNLAIHEDKNRGVYVKGLIEVYVSTIDEVYEVMAQGSASRSVAHTNMNAESSRSHSIFVITIAQKNLVDGGSIKTGKLYLVDLAGSEKVGKTGASGQTLEEAKKINKSLSSLGMVINALTDGKSSHVPYRDSKLTRILQESLGGNSRTTLIINCSPSSYNESESLSTLRFGMRAKKIKNKAKINQDLSPAELKALLKKAKAQAFTFQQYIQLLEGELEIWRTGGSVRKEDYASVTKLGEPLPSLHSRSKSTGYPHVSHDTSFSSVIVSTPNLLSPAASGSENSISWNASSSTLGEDEKEQYLQRENQLMDAIAEKENEMANMQNDLKVALEEVEYLRNGIDGSILKENKRLSEEITDIKTTSEKLKYDNEELDINYQRLIETSNNLEIKLELAMGRIEELEKASEVQDDLIKERIKSRRIEKIAKMMAPSPNGLKVGHHEQEIRNMLSNLERLEGVEVLTSEQSTRLKQDLFEMTISVQEKERAIESITSSNEMLTAQYTSALAKLEVMEKEYSDLVSRSVSGGLSENQSIDELKINLEAQYQRKHAEDQAEVDRTHNLYDQKVDAFSKLEKELRESHLANERLQVELKKKPEIASSNDSPLQQLRLNMAQQLEEFEKYKAEMAQDLERRCERVAELEDTLKETQREYQSSLIENKRYDYNKKRLDAINVHMGRLHQVHKALIDQNTDLKKEVAVMEQKMTTRTNRIILLEGFLEESQGKLKIQAERFEEQIQKGKLEGNKTQQWGVKPSAPVLGRIAKPVRGGGQSFNTTVAPLNRQRTPAHRN